MDLTINLNNDLARVLARIARAKALEIKVPMVIAFTDARGELVHFQRMDKALPVSTDVAMNKAFTAAAIRTPTHELGPLMQPGQELYGLELTNKGRIVIFGGGFPLLSCCNQVIGAIGISGGSVSEDMQVAQAALDAFEEMKQLAETLKSLLPQSNAATASQLAAELAKTELSDRIQPDLIEGACYLLTEV